jgi:hypothetical protein
MIFLQVFEFQSGFVGVAGVVSLKFYSVTSLGTSYLYSFSYGGLQGI